LELPHTKEQSLTLISTLNLTSFSQNLEVARVILRCQISYLDKVIISTYHKINLTRQAQKTCPSEKVQSGLFDASRLKGNRP